MGTETTGALRGVMSDFELPYVVDGAGLEPATSALRTRRRDESKWPFL